jgi:arylsulfatase A-like enzyme
MREKAGIFTNEIGQGAGKEGRCIERNPMPRPNIVFILCDDLGYGDLSCYGQTKFRTPNIDRLATEGMKLPIHYAGNAVCAPSRCVLMTGMHPGHAYIRDNKQAKAIGLPFDEGQVPIPEDTVTLPKLLQKFGYTTGAFGKWGLGPVGSTGEPKKQGIDRFFGYNCQAVAHNFYPTYLWDNEKQVKLNNRAFAAHQKLPDGADVNAPASYTAFRGEEYAPDRISEQARHFIRENKDRPFFLFYPTTVPHLALQVPEDSLAEFAGKYPETPYPGGRSYLPHRTPRAAYAAMIARLDREVGRLLDTVAECGLDNNTIFIFTSDNGPLYNQLGGTDTNFFQSAGTFRGRKGSLYEGGVRVPCLVRWKGKIKPGSVSERVTGFEDWLPTLLELVGAAKGTPKGIDGISLAPTLLGKRQAARPFLYREHAGYGGQQFVRVGDWKLLRERVNLGPRDQRKPGNWELYNLKRDPQEATDMASKEPALVARLAALATPQHQKSTLFPMRELD